MDTAVNLPESIGSAGFRIDPNSVLALTAPCFQRCSIPVPAGIFVIWDGMGLVAKRVEHDPNTERPMVVIKLVNPEYVTYERDAEELHIIGRVVWTSRRL